MDNSLIVYYIGILKSNVNILESILNMIDDDEHYDTITMLLEKTESKLKLALDVLHEGIIITDEYTDKVKTFINDEIILRDKFSKMAEKF